MVANVMVRSETASCGPFLGVSVSPSPIAPWVAMSVDKYVSAQAATENSRQTEYRLFAEVTRTLLAYKDSPARDAPFCAAVSRNRRLWLALQMDLTDERNGLPDELRARLISLAIWVDKYSSTVLRGDGPIDPLISVNRTIMEGLHGA